MKPVRAGEMIKQIHNTMTDGDQPKTPPTETHASRNLVVLAAHAILFRITWIFKTESVIMPAFLDTITGGQAGWLRGCLPALNRAGQSIPPLLYSDRLRRHRRKKWALIFFSSLMGVPFLLLAAIWFAWPKIHTTWLPGIFLVLYGLFFATTGINQLVFGTLQGKLIPVKKRGLLMGTSGLVGTFFSVIAAWWLLQKWLQLPDQGFGYIFLFTGTGFVLAAFIGVMIREPPSQSSAKSPQRHPFRDAWQVFAHDQNFRRLSVVTMLFASAQLIFPHYQALGRIRVDYQPTDLMVWVVVQNIGVGFFSFLAGWVADRFGYRLAIRITIFSISVIPLCSLVLSGAIPAGIEQTSSAANEADLSRHLIQSVARGEFFWITFFLLGMTPVMFRLLTNYTLEIASQDDHPRYLSTLKIVTAIPFVLAPGAGLLVDIIDFAPIFALVSLMILLGGLFTFRLAEPREEI